MKGWCWGDVVTNWADHDGDGKNDMFCDYSGTDAASGGKHWL